ncbi:MAG: hypothetical protein NVSMB46_03210 [Candidatus Saccharimonadales bacterium]
MKSKRTANNPLRFHQISTNEYWSQNFKKDFEVNKKHLVEIHQVPIFEL